MIDYHHLELHLYEMITAMHAAGWFERDEHVNPIRRLPGPYRRRVGPAALELCRMLFDLELPWYQGVFTDHNGDKWSLDWRRLDPTADQLREREEHKFEPAAWGQR